MRRDAHRRGQLAVALAALAWSTAGPLQRELDVDAATQVAGRAFFAMLALFAYVWLVERTPVVAAFRTMGKPGLAFAACTAVASGTFIVALNHTTVANVLFFQAAAPVLAAVFGRAFLGEPVVPRTWVATGLAIAGVTIMMGAPGGGSLLGDGIAIAMTLAFSVGIVITRRHRHVSMAPGTCVAQLVLVVVAGPLSEPGAVNGGDLGVLVALGVFQMGVGLAFLTVGARLVPAAEVAVITLLEVVLGPLWVWLAFAEEPSAATIAGGVVVMAAVALQAGGPLVRRRARIARAAGS